MNIPYAALLGGNKTQDLIKKAGAEASQIKQDTSQPGHTHSDDSSKSQARTAAEQTGDITAPTGGGFGGIIPRPDPSFMGKNQTISDMEFSDMTRGVRAVSPDALDPTGIETAMNPPFAVPVPPNIDDKGVNSLYS